MKGIGTLVLFLGLIFIYDNVVGQKYADPEFYLVDSLVLEELAAEDRILLDSILNEFHSVDADTSKVSLISYLNSQLSSLKAPVLYAEGKDAFVFLSCGHNILK